MVQYLDMDRNTLVLAIKERIFASKLLTTREKWALWAEVKKDEYSDQELKQTLHTLSQEDLWIAEAASTAKQQYLTELNAWHEQLDQIIHHEIPQKLKAEENSDHQKDEEEAELLLEQLEL